MSWVPLAIGGWLVLSVVIALVIGLSIRLADRRARDGRAPDAPVERPGRGAEALAPPYPRPPGDDADALATGWSSVVRGHLSRSERQPIPRTPQHR